MTKLTLTVGVRAHDLMLVSPDESGLVLSDAKPAMLQQCPVSVEFAGLCADRICPGGVGVDAGRSVLLNGIGHEMKYERYLPEEHY